MAVDVTKLSASPDYEVIKDAGGQIIEIRKKPEEYVRRLEKDTGEQEKATFSPHVIKFAEGKPVKEEFYEVNPSIVTKRTRIQEPYAKVVLEYEPSGQLVARKEYKWDWSDRTRGKVVPQLEEKYEGGVKTYVWDAKAKSYVRILDLKEGTETRVPTITAERTQYYTFGPYAGQKLSAEVEKKAVVPKGVGWYDPSQKAFVTAEGKKYPTTNPSWAPKGYVALSAPPVLKPGEAYYEPKIGGVITGEGKFYPSTKAFAPEGTTLVSGEVLTQRVSTKTPLAGKPSEMAGEPIKISGKETAQEIIQKWRQSAPSGYEPTYEGLKQIGEAVEKTRLTLPEREKVAEQTRQMIQEKFWGLKAYGMEPEVVTATLAGRSVGAGIPAVTLTTPVKPKVSGELPPIPTIERRKIEHPTLLERVGKGVSAVAATAPVAAVVSVYQTANKELAKYTNLLLFGTKTPPATLEAGLKGWAEKVAEGIPERKVGVNIPTLTGEPLIAGGVASLAFETPGTGAGYKTPAWLKKVGEASAGYQQKMYGLVTTRPLDVPAVYAVSYLAGAGLGSVGAGIKGSAEALGLLKPSLAWVPKYVVPAGAAALKGGALVAGAGITARQFRLAETPSKKGEVLAGLTYYGVPAVAGFGAGVRTRILPRLTYEELPETVDVKEVMRGGVPVQEPVIQYGYKGVGFRAFGREGLVWGAGLKPAPLVERQIGTMLTAEGLPAGPMYRPVLPSESPVLLPAQYHPVWGTQPVDISRASIGIPAETQATFQLLQKSQLASYPSQVSRVEAAEKLVGSLKVLATKKYPVAKELVKDVGARPVPEKAVEVAINTMSQERGAETYGSTALQSQFRTPYYRAAGGERVPGDIDEMIRRTQSVSDFVTEYVERVQRVVQPSAPSISQAKAVALAEKVVQNLKAEGFDARLSPANKLVIELKGIEKAGEYGKFIDLHHPGQEYPGVVGEQAFSIPLWQQPQTVRVSLGRGETAYIMPQGEALTRKVSSVLSFSPQAGGYAPEPKRVKDIADTLAILVDIQSKGSPKEVAAATQGIEAMKVLYPSVVPSTFVSNPAVSYVVGSSASRIPTVSLVSALSVRPIGKAESPASAVSRSASVSPAVSLSGVSPVSAVRPSQVRTSLFASPSVSASLVSSASAYASMSRSLSRSVSPPSPSPSVSPSASLSRSISRSVSASVSASVSPSASVSVSPSVSVSRSVSPSASVSVSPVVSPYAYTVPPSVFGLPRISLGESLSYGRKRVSKRRFKYTPDIQAVVLRQFVTKAPTKRLFTGLERRFIVAQKSRVKGAGISSKVFL